MSNTPNVITMQSDGPLAPLHIIDLHPTNDPKGKSVRVAICDPTTSAAQIRGNTVDAVVFVRDSRTTWASPSVLDAARNAVMTSNGAVFHIGSFEGAVPQVEAGTSLPTITELESKIHELSIRDPKDLSQVVAKAASELGSLSSAVLGYTEAPAHRHLPVSPHTVAEEAADLVLCAMSVAYRAGASIEGFRALLESKAEYWKFLQNREAGPSEPFFCEFHVTVDLELSKRTVEEFRTTCGKIGVKAIVIDLGTSLQNHPMTSSVKQCKTTQEAFAEMARIRDLILSEGFAVARIKIESSPWHPAAARTHEDFVQLKQSSAWSDSYFETHIPVPVVADDEDTYRVRLKELLMVANIHEAHLSSNASKTYGDFNKVFMVTKRVSTYLEDAEQSFGTLRSAIARSGFIPGNSVIEYALHDSRRSLDDAWIGADPVPLSKKIRP